ncbi:MAG TPA: 50S ribosomal protein L3 N(5)-glutamine methyltransferase [Pseudomonadales bacterium]|nr:50S ribosomal protein L3 N(5)-glutamine methyltransferase [Pseudomonadales bacterium]
MTLTRAGTMLVTVRDWIRWSSTRFARADLTYGHGTSEPWDEALALVGGWLRIPPDRLGDMLDARLTEDERDALAECVRRRCEERVPVPYLTGRAWLAGAEFEVDERVLIPRSPIAFLLAEQLQPWLGARVPRRILDLCTGSGCLGILAALAFPDAEVVLADLSAEALEVARANVRRFDLAERVTVLESDGFDGLAPGTAPFDLVICNPPYVDAADLAAMAPEFTHEPELALSGGGDGIDLVDRLLRSAPRCLAEDGLMVLEVGNSAPALLARFPTLPLTWPELDQGGTGVALIEAADLGAGLHGGQR